MGQLVTTHTVFSGGDFVADESQVDRLSVKDVGNLGPHKKRQEQTHPHGAHPDPRTKVVVVPDLGTDQLRLLKIRSNGTVEYLVDKEIQLEPGSGPRHCLVERTRHGQDVMYVLNELSNSVSTFSVSYPSEDEDGLPRFEPLQSSVSLLPREPTSRQSSFDHWHAAEVKLTPDLRYLIASNRAENHDPYNGSRDGDPDLLAVFNVNDDGTIDTASKRLMSSFGRAPRHFSMSSESIDRPWSKGDRVWVAIAHHDSNDVVIASVEDDGQLTEVARLEDVGRPGVVIWG